MLEWLLYGHSHKWVIIEQKPLGSEKQINVLYYAVQCEKCGRIKSFRVS